MKKAKLTERESCVCKEISGDNKLCNVHTQKRCNENWHVFSPAGVTVCQCGKSTDNPLNKLADEAKKYDL